MATNLDLVKEEHKKVITRIAAYQQQLISNYNKRAKILQFQPEDLVLRQPSSLLAKKAPKRWNLSGKVHTRSIE
ncbi:hypothetical protein FF2_000004 [Malus domestica]